MTGRPIGAARLGYELNLARVSVKLGASAEYGPRNDQTAARAAVETLLGVDARVVAPTLTVSGEYVHVDEEDGRRAPAQAGGHWPVPVDHGVLCARLLGPGGLGASAADRAAAFRMTLYARYEQRHGQFPDFAGASIQVDRFTGGVNLGFGESLQVKAEYLVNRELEGAPPVANNVFTSSAVWTW